MIDSGAAPPGSEAQTARRLAVVPLIDDLPHGQHVARLTFEREVPDRSMLK